MDYFDDCRVVAHSRGRVRLHLPALYRARQGERVVAAAVRGRAGVVAVYASALTGSVLILFDPGQTLAQLLTELGLPAPPPQPKPPPLQQQPRTARRAPGGGADAVSDAASSAGTGIIYSFDGTPATGTSGGRAADIAGGRAATSAPSRAVARRRAALQTLPMAPYAPWHVREADAALAYFGSSPHAGLSQAEAIRRQQGRLPPAKPTAPGTLDLLRRQFRSLPIMLLALSAVVAAATGALAEAAGIGAVLLLNGGLGFVTERRAEAGIAALSELIAPVVAVLRDGALRQIDSGELVPGDVLPLAPGMPVPADLRLLEAVGLALDESALTGESAPVVKHAATLPAPAPLAERGNMAYRGTVVTAGHGLGLAVGTGERTELGAIEALMGGTRRPATPIQRQLDQLGRQLVQAGGAVCAGIFGLGLLRGFPPLAMFETALSLAIAAVPEGLPAVATGTLAGGLVRLRRHKVLVRRLQAVETIGAIHTICLDKTGTLTQNRMAAVALHSVRRRLPLPQHVQLQAAAQERGAGAELRHLLQVCVLCNQSQWNSAAPDASDGSGTENALIALADAAGLDVAALRARYPLRATSLRAEGRNYMRTVHAHPDDGPNRASDSARDSARDSAPVLVAVKGSPTEVLALCTRYQHGAATAPLDAALRAHVLRQNEAMARRQLRVLGFAWAETTPAQAQTAALTWIGLVGLADPLRPGVARAIDRFHRAGIRTVMLTGDQSATAYGIGRVLHLNPRGEPHVVDAGQLEHGTPRQLHTLAGEADIFARVSPAHKLQIVRALQQDGQVVAMTGDGINDGPALRAADIGIAMGGGTDLALSAADVALQDDRLDTLLDAVRQGRTISANIRKSLHFLLSSNLSEILMVLGAVTFAGAPALTSRQLLWLNVLTDLAPALALAAEPDAPDVMARAPRDPRQPIVGSSDLKRYAGEAGVLAGGALSAYLLGVLRHGAGARAGTVGFNALVFGQLLHALSCRGDGPDSAPPRHANPQLAWAAGGSAALQLLANVLPVLRGVLGLAPLALTDLALAGAGALLPHLLLTRRVGRQRAGGARGSVPSSELPGLHTADDQTEHEELNDSAARHAAGKGPDASPGPAS